MGNEINTFKSFNTIRENSFSLTGKFCFTSINLLTKKKSQNISLNSFNPTWETIPFNRNSLGIEKLSEKHKMKFWALSVDFFWFFNKKNEFLPNNIKNRKVDGMILCQFLTENFLWSLFRCCCSYSLTSPTIGTAVQA